MLLLLVIDSANWKFTLDANWGELLNIFGQWNNIRLPEGSVTGCSCLKHWLLPLGQVYGGCDRVAV